jgi:FkbM family methyltransferase
MDTVLEIASKNSEKARAIGLFALASTRPTPLTYVDVGAAWGIDNMLVRMLCQMKHMRVIGFEPDPQEFAALRQAFPDDLYLPCGAGDQDAARRFHVTAVPANSSFLEPDPSVFPMPLRRAQFAVVSTPDIPMRRFDSLIAEGVIPVPDFVKIDAQGFEYNILQGFGKELEKVLGFRMEVQLRPMYKGQALFPDILNFMRSRGFILRDLRPLYPEVYEVLELEIYFSREPSAVQERFRELKIWELLHDIPPGRTVVEGGWMQLSV